MFFESALGDWDLTNFEGKNEEGDDLKTIYYIGIIYMCIFLIINMVFMLNLVIAILTNTFAYLDEMKNGLYYNVLINQFPLFEFDNKYGAIVCA